MRVAGDRRGPVEGDEPAGHSRAADKPDHKAGHVLAFYQLYLNGAGSLGRADRHVQRSGRQVAQREAARGAKEPLAARVSGGGIVHADGEPR